MSFWAKFVVKSEILAGEAADREAAELVVAVLWAHVASCIHGQVVRELVIVDGSRPRATVGIKVAVAIRVDTARPNKLITIIIKIRTSTTS